MGKVKDKAKERNNKSNASGILGDFRAYLPFTTAITGMYNLINPSMEKKTNNKPVRTSYSIANIWLNV